MISGEQTLQEEEAAFVRHLTERARGQHSTIDETLWQHPGHSDTAELTVVSNRKAYIMSLPCPDLTDPHHAAARQQVMRVLLRAIRENTSVGPGCREERGAVSGGVWAVRSAPATIVPQKKVRP